MHAITRALIIFGGGATGIAHPQHFMLGPLPLATVSPRYTCETGYRVEPTGSLPVSPNQNKNRQYVGFNFGGATGTRTLDPMIKSHLLYQLSYSPRTSFPAVQGEL